MTTNSTPLPTRDPSREQARGRVYRGRSVEEVIAMIQADLGPDAIVLDRRAGLTGGVGGFFQRRFVEIEADSCRPRIDVYDEDAATLAPSDRDPATLAPSDQDATTLAPSDRDPATLAPSDQDATTLAPSDKDSATLTAAEPHGDRSADSFAAALASVEAADTIAHALPANGSRDALPHQYDPLQALRANEADDAVSSHPHNHPEALPPNGADDAVTSHPHNHPEALRANETDDAVTSHPHSDPQTAPANGAGARSRARAAIERSLLGCGMSEELVGELIDGATAHLIPLAPRVGLARAVQIALERRIPTCAPLPAAGGMIVLVGPGGSGKTSCCVSLISAYRKSGRLPASCATIVRGGDGPIELLFSPHILTPVPVTAARAARALAGSRSEGLTILDTPPLSSGDRAAIRELATLTGSLRPERVVVALPATLGATAAAQLLEALRPLRASAVAITHADETDQLGVAVEAACRFGLAPEYMLDRARGRGRLTRVDPAQLAQRLLG